MDPSSPSSKRVPGSWHIPDEGLRHRQTDPPLPSRSSTTSSQANGTSQSHSTRQKHYKPRTCRICLETVNPSFHPPVTELGGFFSSGPSVTYDSEGGRLICPCRCKGSSKYVHENCLQEWRYADIAVGTRNYFSCPTCGFQYRLARMGWSKTISSVFMQILLTILIFLSTIFLLGFVADPVINFALDPWGWIGNLFFWSQPYDYDYYYYDRHDFGRRGANLDDKSWTGHFTMGFASLGLLSFLKVLLSSPIHFFSRSLGGGRAAATGRDRLTSYSWVLVLIGAATFIFAVWKGVRLWSRRTLQRASERVLDVQGDDGDDDDDDDD